MVIGGIHVPTSFYNSEDLAANSVEFFPPKDGGVPRPSAFLQRSLPANLFPRFVTLSFRCRMVVFIHLYSSAFLLPDGNAFMVLCCCAEKRDTTNVNLLYRIGDRAVGLRDRLGERVKVADDNGDGRNSLRLEILFI